MAGHKQLYCNYLLPDSKYFEMYLVISEEKAHDLIRLLKAVSIWEDL